jgi:signal transduction histidine kinase
MSFREQHRWLEVWDDGRQHLLYPTSEGEDDALPLPPPPVGTCKSRAESPTTLTGRSNETIRVYCAPFSIGTRHIFIRVGRSEAPITKELREILLIMALVFPVAVAGASLGGLYLARRALSPVEYITARTQNITAERLDDRLRVGNPHDELGRLATVFNDMFERLAKSFETMRRFTSDASHELRTPLTAMISVGEVALLKERDVEG